MMNRQIINNGTNPGDGTGETLYSAFQKANENFAELYNTYNSNPVAAYNSDAQIETITYGSGGQKVMTYTNGYLTQVDFTKDGVTIRKTISYNQDGTFHGITETTVS